MTVATIAGAVISAAGAVGSGILASKNQPKGTAGGSGLGGLGTASQMAPQSTALSMVTKNAQNPNPAFGQFLGGGF